MATCALLRANDIFIERRDENRQRGTFTPAEEGRAGIVNYRQKSASARRYFTASETRKCARARLFDYLVLTGVFLNIR